MPGQGLAGLPSNILAMTGNPTTLIDPKQLPVDPKTCKPVYPHSYLKVNTIFEVAHAAGLRTAWSDKHPAYEILNGPSGKGVQDLFTPEINSEAPTPGSTNDWTTDNALTEQYDHYKVDAVLNEIDGLDHSGAHHVGVPAIFGLNFQTVSTAEKLPTSDGLTGGYLADGVTPGPLLSRALDDVDHQIGRLQHELLRRHLTDSTDIVLSAKHGQSPQKGSQLTRIPDGPIIDALDASWASAHPSGDPATRRLCRRRRRHAHLAQRPLDRRHDVREVVPAAPRRRRQRHQRRSQAIHPFGAPRRVRRAGRSPILRRSAGRPRVFPTSWVSHRSASCTPANKARSPSTAAPTPTTSTFPWSSPAPTSNPNVDGQPVETTQIAPTILRLLGLDPRALQAVRIERTRTLPMS